MNMNEPELFSGHQNQLSVFTPIDALLSEYRKNRDDLERIAAYVATEASVKESGLPIRPFLFLEM
jgi:hypothetical protein